MGIKTTKCRKEGITEESDRRRPQRVEDRGPHCTGNGSLLKVGWIGGSKDVSSLMSFCASQMKCFLVLKVKTGVLTLEINIKLTKGRNKALRAKTFNTAPTGNSVNWA